MKTLKQEWDAIDKAEGSLDARRWKLAERLAKENNAGRTQRDLALEVERHHSLVGRWIQAHRQFVEAGVDKPDSFNQALEQVAGRTPEAERQRKDRTAAKGVLKNPEQRKQVLDSLTEEERLAIAKDAVEPPKTEPKRKPPKRHDEDEDPNRFERDRIIVKLSHADHEIRQAILIGREVEWSDTDIAILSERTEGTKAVLGLLELAIGNEVDIDWDAELERLTEREPE